MPKVSIGMSFYKDVFTIALTIKSILMQTYTDWELILLDDGSADGALSVAESFDDARIRVISDGDNKGLAPRLNELIDLSEGEFFVRIDADDVMHPDRIRQQVKYLTEHADVDVVGTAAYSIDNDNNLLGQRVCREIPSDLFGVFKGSIFIHPSIMGRTKWFRKFHYESETFARRAEDYELWCRSFPTSNFALIRRPLLFYRETASISKGIDSYLCTYDSMRYIIKKHRKLGLSVQQYVFLYLLFGVKKYIYYILWRLGKTDILLKKRFVRLEPREKEEAKRILNSIINEE